MKLVCGSILALFTAVYNFLQPLSTFTFVSVHMISVYYREPCFHANETHEKKKKKKKTKKKKKKKKKKTTKFRIPKKSHRPVCCMRKTGKMEMYV